VELHTTLNKSEITTFHTWSPFPDKHTSPPAGTCTDNNEAICQTDIREMFQTMSSLPVSTHYVIKLSQHIIHTDALETCVAGVTHFLEIGRFDWTNYSDRSCCCIEWTMAQKIKIKKLQTTADGAKTNDNLYSANITHQKTQWQQHTAEGDHKDAKHKYTELFLPVVAHSYRVHWGQRVMGNIQELLP